MHSRPQARPGLALAWLISVALCPAQAPDKSHDAPQFRLVTASLVRQYTGPEFIEELKNAGFPTEAPEVKYSFYAELPEPVIEARKLRFSRVRLASGMELASDQIKTAGKTFRGVQTSFSDNWGLTLDRTGKRLLIHLVLDRLEIDDLARVEGELVVTRGKGSETLATGLMQPAKGNRDTKTGATVSYSTKWGEGCCLGVEIPLPRKYVGAVQVLDADDKPVPLMKPFYYDLTSTGADQTFAKIYVEAPADSAFKLKLTTFKESSQATLPFVIESVNAKSSATSKPASTNMRRATSK